jgi:DNA-binding response OmpR family regulator
MNRRRKVLLVDDDVALRSSLAEQLAADYDTAEAGTGTDALAVAKSEPFDAILLDIGLPVSAPIIMLTASAGEAETVEGLDSGANDYVTKPFRLNELLARLRAQLRLHEASEDAVFNIGPYSFQPGAKLLLDSGTKRKIRLTEKEAAILRFLYRAAAPVSRETLLGEVWGYNAGVNTHTLETHIYRLRQKMERDPANAEILVTTPGGYRLAP